MKAKFKPGQAVILHARNSSHANRQLTVIESAVSKRISLFSGNVVPGVVYECRDAQTGRTCRCLENELARA